MNFDLAAFTIAAAVFLAFGALAVGLLLVWLRDDIWQVEKRTNERFAELEKRIDARFARLEARVAAMEYGRAKLEGPRKAISGRARQAAE